MARVQYATFTVADQLYGVEVSRVQEVFRFTDYTPVPLAPPALGGLINLRGQVIDAVDLRLRMGLPARTDRERMNVVVRVSDEWVSLLVDKIGDVVELDEDAFEAPPDTLTGVARDLIIGAFKLSEGLVLALDADRAANMN